MTRALAAVALLAGVLAPAASTAREYPGFHTPRRAVYCDYAQTRPLTVTCWRPRDGYTVSMHPYTRPDVGYQYFNRHKYEDQSPILRYGKMFGSFKVIGCVSARSGLTCKNRNHHGWTIGKLKVKVF
jgi:hypothetical protein